LLNTASLLVVALFAALNRGILSLSALISRELVSLVSIFDATRLVKEYNQTKACDGKWIAFQSYFSGASYGLGKDGGEIPIFPDNAPEDFESGCPGVWHGRWS